MTFDILLFYIFLSLQQSKRPAVTKTSSNGPSERPVANRKSHPKSSQQNGGVGNVRGDSQSKVPQNKKNSHLANNSGDKYNGRSNNDLVSGGSQSTNNNNITKSSYESHTTISLSNNHINNQGESGLSDASSKSRKGDVNQSQRTAQEHSAQQPVYSVRSIKDRNQNPDSHSKSSQSDEESEPLSVARARNLFESGSNKSSAVKRNFSIGAKDTSTIHSESQKAQWKLTEPSRPYRSASLHNLHRSVDSGMSVKDPSITDTSFKKSNTTMTLTSKTTQSATSQKAKPMGKAPVVRTAWSQQPKPSATGTAKMGTSGVTSSASQNAPLTSKAKLTVTTKSTPHLAGNKVPENSSKQGSSLHPLFQTLPGQGNTSEDTEGEKGHTFDLPKLKPVDKSSNDRNIPRRHSTGRGMFR